MSRALLEEVSWDAKRITSVDWETYYSFYLGLDLPAIDVILINKLGVPATGGGELAITLVAAAVGNAIFDAIGIRLRQAPFTAERVKDALRSLA
jgi:CO/xanthine dehydrogenase Mo-binding subunit